MNDLIDRQTVTAKCFQAMKIISGEFGQELSQNDESYNTGLRKAIEIVRSLPPATPTEKIGQWVTVDKGLIVTSYKCSECGRIVRDDTGYDVTKDYPYCHCGAKMEVE